MNKIILPTIIVTVTGLPFLLKYLLKQKYKKILESLEDQDENNCYYQCIFINMDNFYCRPHVLEKKDCSPSCSHEYEKTILSFIISAQKSICLCMYMMSLKQVNYELIKAHKRGIKVRLITDRVMLRTDVMQIHSKHRQLHGEYIILNFHPNIFFI